MAQKKKKIKIYCGTCKQSTNHIVIAQRSTQAPPEYDIHESYGAEHYFCQCAGCNSYSYAVATWYQTDFNPDTGGMNYTWETYPEDKSHLSAISDLLFSLPTKIRLIYQEIISAMNARLPILTAIGLRALIEAICKDQGIGDKKDNLEKRIDGLATSGILSKNQALILHDHRFLGNIAAHEIEPAQKGELLAALEIAETMLKTIYILPNLSKEISTGKKPC
ncbi:DUF4145 domain-containing protein [Synechococcus sp. BDU 130192]|uniref:DUF4145 domain-containing protein n=1 Tax=Synechococcus sp. BDU 130192 TaxID=2042059 RepID=UPI000C0752E1|nr:DUF4145 domain-containing protein [Synechococcus sp. BDU 130192]